MTINIKGLLTVAVLLFGTQISFAGATEDLWKALKSANYPNAISAITAGADVKNLDPSFGTPLNFAACWADANVVKALIDAKSEINFVTPSNGNTPLINAATWGNVEAVKLLLAAGGDIKIKNKLGQTILANAVGSANLDVIKLLVDAGANPNEKFDIMATKNLTLMYSIIGAYEPAEKINYIKGVSTAMAKFEVTFPPRLQNPKESDFTPLGDITKYLLEKGVDPNQKVSGTEISILDRSIELGKIGVAKALIEKGAKFDIDAEFKVKDKNNPDPLYPNLIYENGDYILVAVMSNNYDFVKFMVEKYPKQISKTYAGTGTPGGACGIAYYKVKGITLLMVAAERGNPEIVKYLIGKGFDKDDFASGKWAAKTLCPILLVRRTIGFARNSHNDEVIELIKKMGGKDE